MLVRQRVGCKPWLAGPGRKLTAVAAAAGLAGAMGLAAERAEATQAGKRGVGGPRLPVQVPFPPLRGAGDTTAAPARQPAVPPPPACIAALAGRAVVAQRPPIVGPNGCGAPDAVRLEAVIARSGRRIALEPAADLRCDMAEAVVDWVRYDVIPAMPVGRAPLASIATAASYDCRTRNHIAGAIISEHGLANALDIRAFRLADGATLDLTDRAIARPLRERIRATACERFSTVLGPGSDGFHEDHIHVDLRDRRGGFRLCRWDVLDPAPAIAGGPPMPPPRPSTSMTTASIPHRPDTKPLPSVLRGRQAVAHLPKVEQSPPAKTMAAVAPMPPSKPATRSSPSRAGGTKQAATRRSGTARPTEPGLPTDLRKMLRF